MNKRTFWTLLVIFLLWIIGIFLYLGKTEKSIAEAVNQTLNDPKHQGKFSKVTYTVSGQEITLGGEVATQEDAIAARNLVLNEVRTAGIQVNRNPVIEVNQLVKAATTATSSIAAQPEIPAPSVAAADVAAVAEAPLSYISLAGNQKAFSVFGIVPSEQDKSNLLDSLKASLPSAAINSDFLSVDSSYKLAQGANWNWSPTPAEGSFIGLFPHGCEGKYFSSDTQEDAIRSYFPKLKFNLPDWNNFLGGFYSGLKSAAPVQEQAPQVAEKPEATSPAYLQISSNGKKLIVTGEVANEETRSAFIKAIQSKNPQFEIQDQIQISSQVAALPNLNELVEKAPVLDANVCSIAWAKMNDGWKQTSLKPIYFQTGNASSQEYQRALAEIKAIRQCLPDSSFEIIGHTDNVGSPESNMQLSNQRAQALFNKIKAAGLNVSNITARGAGQNEPTHSNETPQDRALNRRVDIILK